MPTSRATAPTSRRAKWSSPIAVVISKNVGPRYPRPSQAASSATTAGRTASVSATSSSGVASRPSTANRSSSRCRCGELNSPVRTPEADSAAATIAEVDPFPLVPATWTIRSASCGSWSHRSSRRIRPSRSSAGVRGMPSLS